MPKLQITVGLPASGKTSWAKGQLKKHKDTVAFSYDDFRMMCFNDVQNGSKGEDLVRTMCKANVVSALVAGYNVIIHNTNLTDRSKNGWQQLADDFNHVDKRKVQFEIVDFTKVPVDTCIGRDNMRTGYERVAPPVIWNMALHSGLLKGYFDSNKKIVIVDVDGTLADHEGVRGPFDEHKVHLDKPYEVVVQWVRNLVHHDEHETYQVIVVSGRSTVCALSTDLWLRGRISYSALFMRNRGDRRPDTEVKQEILSALLTVVPKEQIAFVIDDRPKVIKMWKNNGLTVYPARGAVEDF